MYNVPTVNPAGINTVILDTTTSRSLHNILKDSPRKTRIGNVLSDKVRADSLLIADYLYLVRIHAYDESEGWYEGMDWNDEIAKEYNEKELFYFLVIDENYNELYTENINSNIYLNFNNYDYHDYNIGFEVDY
jgi:hypothetical protein